MTKTKIKGEYFEWMRRMVCDRQHTKGRSYKKLLDFLYQKEFTYILPMDENRADDGVALRYRFIREHHYNRDTSLYLDDQPCSVLEMMIALALRCEESIMYDPDAGDRTCCWFWDMIDNLGLRGMDDSHFNGVQTNYILDRFLNRKYDRYGRGNLFTVKCQDKDLRDVEIWYQMCWYLDFV